MMIVMVWFSIQNSYQISKPNELPLNMCNTSNVQQIVK